MRHRLLLALLFVSATSGLATAEDTLSGEYLRQTKTCGGPGFADGGGSCDLVTEDSLKVTQKESTSELKIFFYLSSHWYQEHCQYEGQGILTKNILVLDAGPKNCRLKVKFERGSARLIDPGNQCVSQLCTDPRVKLHGVTYKRAKNG